MVSRVHKYANGGKIVRDHLKDDDTAATRYGPRRTLGSPGVRGAVKDAVNAVSREVGRLVAPEIPERKPKIDDLTRD